MLRFILFVPFNLFFLTNDHICVILVTCHNSMQDHFCCAYYHDHRRLHQGKMDVAWLYLSYDMILSDGFSHLTSLPSMFIYTGLLF